MTAKQIFIDTELRQETELRLRKLLPLMQREGLDAILVGSNANIFYLSGRFYRGYVYLDKEGRRRYFVISPADFAAAPEVAYIRKPEQIPALLSEAGLGLPQRIGLEYDSLFYSEIGRLQKVFAESQTADCSAILREARMVKTPYEIGQMREDGGHQVAVYRRIGRLYKKDMTDLEFQIEIEHVLRLEGCLGYLRTAGHLMEINMGSVINGANADRPTPYDFSMGGSGVSPSMPVGADGTTMKNGTTVMVDMNGNFNGYQTDMTRVWSIGEVPAEALKAHECSRKILRSLEKMARPGVEIRALYEEALRIAEEDGLAHCFMGHHRQVGFIGHGVGIELNEQPAITPKCRVTLKSGMTLALEPKFVIPEVGAVGVENTYVVTDSGLDNLTDWREEIVSLI